MLQTVDIRLIVKFDPVWLLDPDAKSLAALDKVVVDTVGCVVVATTVGVFSLRGLVNHDPLFATKVDSFLDSQIPQYVLIDVDDLVLLEDLGLCKDSLAAQVDWVALDGELEVTEDLLLHQRTNQTVDFSHLLLWSHATDREAVTHARTGSDAVRDAVDATELWRQMNVVLTVLDNDQGLVQISDSLAVDLVHVFGDADLLIVVHKSLLSRIRAVVDVRDDVSALAAPISNDAGANNLSLNPGLELVLTLGLLTDLLDLVKARDCRHKSEESVDGDVNA